MKPLNDRVLVKRLESEEKTAGGLFIPDAAKEKPSKGEIVACGPGKMTEAGVRAAMEVKVGDVVNVVVLEVDEKRHRISLSMKQAKQK